MAHVRPILQRLSWSNETVQNALKHEFWVEWIGSRAFVMKNSNATKFWQQLSCSNKMDRNAPKQEFWVQWSGSGALVVNIFNATSFREVVR
jgi:hypothetical protein